MTTVKDNYRKDMKKFLPFFKLYFRLCFRKNEVRDEIEF